ncbi:hypothetical protein HMPREF9413_3880 [Paenibacillus sp. HGF7]|nr:hypothetical protein HMPREF9413_3880 [Paenibacillus sp. HGF7]
MDGRVPAVLFLWGNVQQGLQEGWETMKTRIARGTRGVRIGNSTGVHGVHGRRGK